MKLKSDEPLSSFAFHFNLRRCIKATPTVSSFGTPDATGSLGSRLAAAKVASLRSDATATAAAAAARARSEQWEWAEAVSTAEAAAAAAARVAREAAAAAWASQR